MKSQAQSLGRRGLVLLVVLCSLLGLSAAAAQTPGEVDLRRADWSVNAPHGLAHNPPSEEAVRSFMHSLHNSVASLTNEVCNAHFADLKQNGTLSLVVGDDGGGTVDCNYTEIVDKNADSFDGYDFDGFTAPPSVEDIDGDGRSEVIVDAVVGREHFDTDSGAGKSSSCANCWTCAEYWPRVYAWTGTGYTDVSSQYPKYYERELISLKKQIASIYAAQAAARRPAPAPTPMQLRMANAVAIEVGPGYSFVHQNSTDSPGGGPGSSAGPVTTKKKQTAASGQPQEPQATETPDSSDLDCLKAESGKMERFLGRSKDAGMSDVIEWANSNSPSQRDFATEVLRDIGTAEALKYEQTLTRDSDHRVASTAKSELEDWGRAENPVALELESSTQIAPNSTDRTAKSAPSQSGGGQN